MGLKDDLVWYWDLSAADASIVDQHSGLSLAKVGSVATAATGGPDGGPCIDVGAAAGKYRNGSVAKTVSYDDGYSVNIWVRSTAYSSAINTFINHRDSHDDKYFQIFNASVGVSSGNDAAVTFATASDRRGEVARQALGLWQMLTLVDNGTSTALYRNGVSIGVGSNSLAGRDTANAAFAIGGDSWNSGISANLMHRGQLAMAGVWNEPLTPTQITQLYNGGNGLRYADLDAVADNNPTATLNNSIRNVRHAL
jgi:hypothetical protein